MHSAFVLCGFLPPWLHIEPMDVDDSLEGARGVIVPFHIGIIGFVKFGHER